MESRIGSGAGPPNTIMIQLVSQPPTSSGQMQAMPISVQAIPLFPGNRKAGEQPPRSDSISPNMRAPAEAPPRMHPRIRPEMCAPPKRKSSQSQLRGSCPRYSSSGASQPTVRYVVRPEDRIIPIYIPVPRATSNCFSNVPGGRMERECPCCGRGGTLNIPEGQIPQVPPKQMEPPGRRDQATNTNDQPDLADLRTICETLGRAMMAAATAAVESAHNYQLEKRMSISRSSGPDPKDPTNIMFQMLSQLGEQESPTPTKQEQSEVEIPVGENPSSGEKRISHDPPGRSQKASFSETVLVGTKIPADESPSKEWIVEQRLPSLLSDGRFHVEYPRTPRPTPVSARGSVNTGSIVSSDQSRLLSGSWTNEGTLVKNSNIFRLCQRAGLVPAKQWNSKLTARKSLGANQASALIAVKGLRSPSIRRRFPTEKLPTVKGPETCGPTSPNSSLPVEKQPKDPSGTTLVNPL